LDEFGAHFRDADTGQEMNISYWSARVALADYPSTLCSVGRVDISGSRLRHRSAGHCHRLREDSVGV